MDKIALISDIHANLEALEAVLEDIAREGVSEIISLGDNVGYGPNPIEVLQRLYQKEILSLEGNHDLAVVDPKSFADATDLAVEAIEWTRLQLRRTVQHDIDFQDVLVSYFGTPASCIFKKDPRIILVHGAPGEETRFDYLLMPDDFLIPSLYMKRKGLKICFFGHTHRQVLWEVDDTSVALIEYDIDVPIEFSNQDLEEAMLFINPGSVGQPRDGDPLAAYAIYENVDDKHLFTFKRIPYEVEKTVGKIYSINELDNLLGDRLITGE